MFAKPMCLVTIYPDGWVEARSTDDVRVKIHTVPVLRGNGSDVDAEHGIGAAALLQAYEELPWLWQQLVDETDARGIHSGMPNSCPEEERREMAARWVLLGVFRERIKADAHLRLELVQVQIPQWMKDHAEEVRLGRVGKRWRETYQDESEGV